MGCNCPVTLETDCQCLNIIIAMVSVCEVAGVQLPVDQLPVDGDGNDTISVVWSRTISEGSKFLLWFQGSSYSYSNLSLTANMTMVVESLTWVEERKGAEVGSPSNWKSVCTTRPPGETDLKNNWIVAADQRTMDNGQSNCESCLAFESLAREVLQYLQLPV